MYYGRDEMHLAKIIKDSLESRRELQTRLQPMAMKTMELNIIAKAGYIGFG